MTLLTEKEAAEKWCPMVRYKSVNGEGINRWASVKDKADNPDPSRCIGSRCMAWRWDKQTIKVHGFCGAFGKVEP